ncbi:MAG: archaeal proteasome endopeptidase complex subunit alpha [Promethearchaeota archaeon]
MFSNPGMNYDRSITQFSPDGRLFQVEYAIEAVRRGTIAVALKNQDSVVFVVEKRNQPLQEYKTSEKIFKIDDHCGAAIAGLTADARILIDQARIKAQVSLLYYAERVSIKEVTEEICDQAQYYTQMAGARPFGVSLLLGGIDNDGSAKIYMTDPSGAYWGYNACAIGAGSQNARQFLEKEYKKDLNFEELIALALKTLKNVLENEVTPEICDIAYVKKGEKFTFVGVDEKTKLIEKYTK